jgi:putative phage-type endonuclease
MIVLDDPQGSDAWMANRVGRVTASRVADILAKTKTGVSASRAGYLGELVAERLTGMTAASAFMNDDMRRGIELEPDARFAYEVKTGNVVAECGFVLHPTLHAGASPDGLVGDDGLLELKCPRTHVHIEYIEAGKPPPKYQPQMAWQCICTGRPWVDFASYDPRMPEKLQLFVVRYTPSMEYLRELEAEVTAFIAEVDAKVAALSRLL